MKSPVTAAVRVLRSAGISYTEHPYSRGFLLGVSPGDMMRILSPVPVRVAIERDVRR